MVGKWSESGRKGEGEWWEGYRQALERSPGAEKPCIIPSNMVITPFCYYISPLRIDTTPLKG